MNRSTSASSMHSRFKDKTWDIGRVFSSIPPWMLFMLVLFMCVLMGGIGTLIGRQQLLSGYKEIENLTGTAVAAILGLLAFMLGFTFSLTWTRFADLNGLVIAQANAIAICYLRTSLIPELQKVETRKLLKEYVNLLIDVPKVQDMTKELARIEEIHLLIWRQTASLVSEDMDSEMRSLFTNAVNELIGFSMKRKIIGLFFLMPNAIWASLLLLTAMGMFSIGYQAGVSGSRRIFEIPLVPIAFGIVIILIADLNSTRLKRHFKVSQQPLQDIQKMIDKDIP